MSKNVAILNNNTVINIIIVNDDYELNVNEVFYTEENPAFMHGDYVDGYFYSAQPFPSWSRDGAGRWLPPIPKPDTKCYWDESTLSWIDIEA